MVVKNLGLRLFSPRQIVRDEPRRMEDSGRKLMWCDLANNQISPAKRTKVDAPLPAQLTTQHNSSRDNLPTAAAFPCCRQPTPLHPHVALDLFYHPPPPVPCSPSSAAAARNIQSTTIVVVVACYFIYVLWYLFHLFATW